MNEHKKLLLKELKTIPPDFKAICQDGEIAFNSSLVSLRNPVFKRMLEGEFKEAKEKVIRFPEQECKVVKNVMNYLQFAKLPIGDGLTLLKTYLMADQYGIENLCNYIMKDSKYFDDKQYKVFKMYEFCKNHHLETMANELYRCIKRYITIGNRYFECEICKDRVYSIRCCQELANGVECDSLYSAYDGNGQCPKCGYDITGIYHESGEGECNGIHRIVDDNRVNLSKLSISEATRLELFDRLFSGE